MNLLKLCAVRFNTNLDPYTLGQRESMLLECISLKSTPKVALKGMFGRVPSRLNLGGASKTDF